MHRGMFEAMRSQRVWLNTGFSTPGFVVQSVSQYPKNVSLGDMNSLPTKHDLSRTCGWLGYSSFCCMI